MQRIVACTFLCFLFFPTVSFGQKSLVIFSGDLRGEIKPCGCAEEGDMGGLPRRLTFFKQQLSQIPNLLYFDLGNNFPEPSEQGDLKIQLIQTALKKLAPQVVLVGPNEWLNGLQSLDPEIPYLLSNQNQNLHFLASKTVSQAGQQTILVVGFLSPELVYQNQNEAPLLFPVDPELLANWKNEFEKINSVFRILLFRGNEQELQKFEKSALFDLIVVGSNNDDELKQVMVMKTKSGKFPMIPTKGQGILSGKLSASGKLIPNNNETVPAGLSLTWLRSSFEDAPELAETFRNYDAAVKELFFTNLDRMDKQRDESPFVGNQVCAGCHAEIVSVWKKSRHAHAFATLENKAKHFDPECLACHVVGMKPWVAPENASAADRKFAGKTGFLSMQITPHLKNVQCENCHGPARAHLANPKIHPANNEPKMVCANCHRGSHSPLFNFETYWPKIKH
jgi:hypothetical protein